MYFTVEESNYICGCFYGESQPIAQSELVKKLTIFLANETDTAMQEIGYAALYKVQNLTPYEYGNTRFELAE